MNAMAGGGTLLTFPALVFLGMPAIEANATSTVALLPGAAASMAGYREEVARNRGWLKTLFLPSLLGGTLGSVLLLRTPEKTFQLLVDGRGLSLDHGDRRDEAAGKGEAGDREVAPRPLGLGAVIRPGRDLYLAEAVFFDACIGHDSLLAAPMVSINSRS